MLRLLDEMEAQHTIYLKPESLSLARIKQVALNADLNDSDISTILGEFESSDTGLVLFWGKEQVTAIAPPFPLDEDAYTEASDVAPLVDLLHKELLIGIVLLRLERYAIGVLRGEYLAASKTASRYMKNRHRAGGQSQRRFERSRERLIRELYDKTCEVVRDVFTPFEGKLDYVLLGGEQNTLRGLNERCRCLQDLKTKTLSRTLPVDHPNHAALESIAFEAWKSRVVTFENS